MGKRKIGIQIGRDQPDQLEQLNKVVGPDNGPRAYQYLLGWALSVPKAKQVVNYHAKVEPRSEMEEELQASAQDFIEEAEDASAEDYIEKFDDPKPLKNYNNPADTTISGMDLEDLQKSELLLDLGQCSTLKDQVEETAKLERTQQNLDENFTIEDKEGAMKTFIKEAQASEIAKKPEQLEEEEKVSGRSKIASMKPHLDEDGTTRCISRLEATRNVPEHAT